MCGTSYLYVDEVTVLVYIVLSVILYMTWLTISALCGSYHDLLARVGHTRYTSPVVWSPRYACAQHIARADLRQPWTAVFVKLVLSENQLP